MYKYRRNTRILIIQLIYHKFLNPLDNNIIINNVQKISFLYTKNMIDKKYFNKISKNILEKIPKLEKIIYKIHKNINYASFVDISIIILAVYEFIYERIPFKVVINEALEISKIFGSFNNSYKYVNILLDNIFNYINSHE